MADVQPARIITAPPFEQLVARRQARALARRISLGRVARMGTAAASLMLAVAAGWWTRGRVDGRPDVIATSTVASATLDQAPATPLVADDAPTPADNDEARTLTAVSPVQPIASEGNTGAAGSAGVPSAQSYSFRPTVARVMRQPAVQVSSLPADDEIVPLDGIWQSVGWQEATALSGGNVPRIEGLPVVDIQLQRGLSDERPLVVVAQQHPSGKIIRTIEGPWDRVAALLDQQLAVESNRLSASSPSLTPPDYIAEGTERPRRGLRVLTVTGNLPADSLNALARGIDLRD